MRTIAVVNQKGGCGKTTISINLASALAEFGKKTLLVDLDPQSHCAVGLAVPEEQIEQSIYDILISKSRGEPIRLKEILWQISDKLELAPASIDLSAFEQQMVGVMDRESCLRHVLSKLNGSYDFAIIDCPPSVGLLTFNALRAATEVIVPVETGYFALHGLSKQLETLNILCKRCKQEIDVKVLASMYDIRTKMAREILGELRNHFSEKMFKTIVNFNTKIKEAASFGQPICEYDPASKGQADFRMLAEEIMAAESKSKQHDIVNNLSDQLDKISTSAEELLKSAQIEPEIVKLTEQPQPQPQSQIAPEVVSEPAVAAPVVSQPEITPIPVSAPPVSEPIAEPVAFKPEVSQPTQSQPAVSEAVVGQAIESKPEMSQPVAAQPVVQEPKKSLEEKLSDYYGVSQRNGAVVFVSLYPHAKDVYIAGDFNNWLPSKTKMQKVGDSGLWQMEMNLAPGRYRYRMVVDGKWQQDPYNEVTEVNPFGELNSVMEVK